MTMFNKFCLIAMVLLISTASMATSRSIDQPIGAPSSDDGYFSPLAPSPALSPAQKKFNAYLEACADKLTEKCGEEIFSYIFEGQNYHTVTDHCCGKLLEIGEQCHIDMTNYSVGLPQYKSEASVFLGRSEIIWDLCSLGSPLPSEEVVESGPSPSPYSYDEFSPVAPSPTLTAADAVHLEYLEMCADKLTEECGEEMFSFVFENDNSYSGDCCKKLVSIGQECHSAMTEYSAGLPQYKANASVFLARSELIWGKCLKGENVAEVPHSDADFSPLAPSPALKPEQKAHNAYLESCAAKLEEECGEEVFSYVFESERTYSFTCCEKLLSIGKDCHAAMTEYTVELPQYKANASVFLSRSEQIWNKCSSIA